MYGAVLGHWDDSQSILDDASKLVEKSGEVVDRIVANALIGEAYRLGKLDPTATKYLDAAIEKAESGDRPNKNLVAAVYYNMALGYKTEFCSYWGEFELGRVLIGKALDSAQEIGDRATVVNAQSISATLEVVRGNFNAAKVLLDPIVEYARRSSHIGIFPNSICYLGYAEFYLGNPKRGIKLAEEAITAGTFSALRNKYIFPYVANSLTKLSYMEAITGKFKQAKARLAILSDMGYEGSRLENIACLVNAIVSAGEREPDWNAVDGHAVAAIRLATEGGYRPNLAEIHFRFAELMHKKGDIDQAKVQLDQAIAHFNELGMVWWPVQAEALLGRIERGKPFAGFAPYAE